VVVDHEAQRVGDVALEREEGRAVEKVAVRHLAALKAVADLGVVLGVDGRDLDEGHDGLALVAPQVALVGERDGPDRARAVEVARLRPQYSQVRRQLELQKAPRSQARGDAR